jgi:hypothetical protein
MTAESMGQQFVLGVIDQRSLRFIPHPPSCLARSGRPAIYSPAKRSLTINEVTRANGFIRSERKAIMKRDGDNLTVFEILARE